MGDPVGVEGVLAGEGGTRPAASASSRRRQGRERGKREREKERERDGIDSNLNFSQNFLLKHEKL